MKKVIVSLTTFQHGGSTLVNINNGELMLSERMFTKKGITVSPALIGRTLEVEFLKKGELLYDKTPVREDNTILKSFDLVPISLTAEALIAEITRLNDIIKAKDFKPKVITVKKGSQMGATIGAFMYAYYISFSVDGYSYTFQGTEEGMGTMLGILQACGHEVIIIEDK
jgi:hypothetical protein